MAAKPYFPTRRDLPDSSIQKIFDALLNLVYPDRCFVCSIPVARRQECGVCHDCWNKAVALKITSSRCSSCGLPFQNFDDAPGRLCGNCILQTPAYSGARSFGYYAGELTALIHGLKFQGRRNMVALLGPLLADTFFDNWQRGDFDLIVPVPLHPKRKRERGYNQSELLARALSRYIALPCESSVRRVRLTLPQLGLSDLQRKENVRKAFMTGAGQVAGKRILLIDDVMTTGATVSSAAKALIDGGALRVSVLTVARAAKW